MTAKQADSKEAPPDSSGHLLVPGELSAFVCLLTTIAMRTLRSLYHSIPLDVRTPMRRFPTLADICPVGIPLYLPADLYSHADSSKPTPFDSPLPADSNAPCPKAVRPLVAGLSILLYLSSLGRYLQIVSY